jgi:hypothetical protein
MTTVWGNTLWPAAVVPARPSDLQGRVRERGQQPFASHDSDQSIEGTSIT